MEKKLVLKAEPSNKSVQKLMKELDIRQPLAYLLAQRNILDFNTAKSFFNPSVSQLHDPFLMKDMDKAVERISKAFDKNEKILIYGDYDVDGTTSVSLMYSFLFPYYSNIAYYIPDRYTEGYGISTQGIDFASDNEFSLIIALDCGIKSIDKISYANEKGIDFIVCDHHRPGDVLPPAIAILDPKRDDCTYPFKELPGCGIGFKLAQALCQKLNWDFTNLLDTTDFVATGIACDIVPIVGENRVLCYLGLQKINTNPRTSMQVLFEKAGKKIGNIEVVDLVFIAGPRINAAGRIDHAHRSVELLLSTDTILAEKAAAIVEDNNRQRKELDATITQKALEMIEQDDFLMQAKSTILYHEDWHKGVVGIVASRVIESYYRPTIILTKSNEFAVGSARSVKGFDVYNAIEACGDLLEQFGGHTYAAGLTVQLEKLDELKMRFNEVVAASITDEQLTPKVEIDMELHIEDITPSFYNSIKRMSPFGPENMNPVFLSRNVQDAGMSKRVGADASHLKIHVYQAEVNKTLARQGIAFGMGEHYERIKSGEKFHIVYNLEENVWNGISDIQLMVREIIFGELVL